MPELTDNYGEATWMLESVNNLGAFLTKSLVLLINWTLHYCAISINSAGHVTRYMPAEILNSAHGGNDRYMHFFSADFTIFLRFLKPF